MVREYPHTGTDIVSLQYQLYSKGKQFRGFQDITADRYMQIKSLIKRRNERTKPINKFIGTGLLNYAESFKYVNSQISNRELKTYDEQILFLILANDPNLRAHKLFLSTSMPSAKEIDLVDDDEKEELNELRRQGFEELKAKSRNELGFYDPSLIKYEEILKTGFYRTGKFEEDVKISFIKPLTERAKILENLDIVTNNAYERIKELAARYEVKAKDPKDLNSLAYNLLYLYQNFGIHTLEEQLIIFLLIADPSLALLRIYEEESTYPKFEERAMLELGFQSRSFIKFERLYHDKFEPDKTISPWTK